HDIRVGPDGPSGNDAVVSSAGQRMPVHDPEQDRLILLLGLGDPVPERRAPRNLLPLGVFRRGSDKVPPVRERGVIEDRGISHHPDRQQDAGQYRPYRHTKTSSEYETKKTETSRVRSPRRSGSPTPSEIARA